MQKQNQHILSVLSAHECKIIPHRQCEAYYNYRRIETKWIELILIFLIKINKNVRKLSISSLMICRNKINTPSQSYQHTNAKSSHIDSVRRITTIGEPCPFSSKRGFFLRFSSCSAKRGNPCRVEAIRNSLNLFSIVYEQVKIGEFRGELIKSIYREETLQRMKLSRKYKCRNLWEGFLLEEWTMKKALCENLAYYVCLREQSFSRTE